MDEVKIDDYLVGKVIKTIVQEGSKIIIKTEDGIHLTLVPFFDVILDTSNLKE